MSIADGAIWRALGPIRTTSWTLAYQPEAGVKLNQMIWSRIGYRQPAPWPEHPRRLGEILWRENVDDEVDHGVLHRPYTP